MTNKKSNKPAPPQKTKKINSNSPEAIKNRQLIKSVEARHGVNGSNPINTNKA